MTDEQTAAAIVADHEMSSVNAKSMAAAIVRALQQARDEAGRDGFKAGYMAAIDTHANAAVLRMCHEARMMNGIVDYSDQNATGVVRRVDGQLPILADGVVAEYGNSYWYWDIISQYHQPIKYGWTERVLESCEPQDAEYSWTTDPKLCYSTKESALKVRKEQP